MVVLAHKEKIEYILIACCTCKRVQMLAFVLWNLAKIKLPPDNIKVELLIVDNSVEDSSFEVVNNFSKNFPLKIHYVTEEKRGICYARNRVLKEAVSLGATHLALFDDDGLLDENWLINYIDAYNNSDAMIFSGPQYTWFCDKYPKYITQNNIFKNSTTKHKGDELTSCATNNVFFSLAICREHDIKFDEMYVFMGGEDGDFFGRLHEMGYKIIFTPDSIVKEITDEKRANVDWVIKRSYYNGYSGSHLKFKFSKNLFKKVFYLLKLILVAIWDILIFPLSLLMGKKSTLNTACILAKNVGKITGCLNNSLMNYYGE